MTVEDQSDATGRLGQQSWILAEEFKQQQKNDLFEDQAGILGLPLWGISTDQIKRCHSKLESLCLKQMTC